jgi:hypothetical protein
LFFTSLQALFQTASAVLWFIFIFLKQSIWSPPPIGIYHKNMHLLKLNLGGKRGGHLKTNLLDFLMKNLLHWIDQSAGIPRNFIFQMQQIPLQFCIQHSIFELL